MWRKNETNRQISLKTITSERNMYAAYIKKKCIFFPLTCQRTHGIMEQIGGYADHYSNMNNCTTCKQKDGFTPSSLLL
jgi:hypothetical protein